MKNSNIIIFGKGKVFKANINNFFSSKIIAITDNDIKNNEELNFRIRSIAPYEIKDYAYDYIVICTGYQYALEIYNQLVDKLKISPYKIISYQKYFGLLLSWENYSFLNTCRSLGIKNIWDYNDYFYSRGVLTCTNVHGFDYSDINFKYKYKYNGSLLLGVFNSKEAVEGALNKISNNATYSFILIIYNNIYKEELEHYYLNGYNLIFIETLDMRLAAFKRETRKTSIYIISHKEYTKPEDKIYRTLWVGAEESNTNCKDNISYLNHKINECTGLYWMWKNALENIIGLNHYRRFFLGIDNNNIICEKEINFFLQQYDIIVANSTITYPLSIKEHLHSTIEDGAFIMAWDLIEESISKRHQEYICQYNKVMSGYAFFPCNMFITRREIMNEYCEWLFPIIIPAAEQFDETPYDDYSKRAIGFFAERLLTVWLLKQDYKIKELPIILTQDDAKGSIT